MRLHSGDTRDQGNLPADRVEVAVRSAFDEHHQIGGAGERPACDDRRQGGKVRHDVVAILAGLKCDGDQGPDRRVLVLDAETDGVAGDDALGFEAPQTLVHAAAREAGMSGERHQALA